MPAGAVTLMGPVITPTGTVAPRVVLLVTLKLADSPLKLTADAPRKFWPVTVILLPWRLLLGEKLVMLAGRKKFVTVTKVPLEVVTDIGPVVAVAGTLAVTWFGPTTVGDEAATPLNFTAERPSFKLKPLMVTLVPVEPTLGEKPVIVGWKVKLLVVMEVPAGAVSHRGPLLAPEGTLACKTVLLRDVIVAATPLTRNEVVPRKLVPVTVRLVPARPAAGEKPVMAGGAKKLELVVKVPRGLLTAIGPVITPAGVLT